MEEKSDALYKTLKNHCKQQEEDSSLSEGILQEDQLTYRESQEVEDNLTTNKQINSEFNDLI